MTTPDHDRIIHVDDAGYEEMIDEGLVLLDFWAEWCGPCTAMEPVIQELADEHPALTVAKIDADGNEQAIDEFGVQSIPTFILLMDGEPVEAFVGREPYTNLAAAVREYT